MSLKKKIVSFQNRFTSVFLWKTIHIILDCICNKNLITAKTKKDQWKDWKTFKRKCFSLDGILFEHMVGVLMGSCLAPLLANIIMIELESSIVDKLFKNSFLKFDIHYINDTLTLIKISYWYRSKKPKQLLFMFKNSK